MLQNNTSHHARGKAYDALENIFRPSLADRYPCMVGRQQRDVPTGDTFPRAPGKTSRGGETFPTAQGGFPARGKPSPRS
ncbi:MAG: hypothetical protein LBD64_05365, partial [Odoribacteraceae bacterium]|nr:hypothetical protein [Odoribacteraceae bacterium]